MKKVVFIFLIFHFSSIIINAQWVQQYQTTLYKHLYDVRFINKNTGWTCGSQGMLLKTTNGGTNWFEQNTNITNKILSSVFPVNSNIVYIVGYFETILKSTNGGENWIQIKNGPYGEGHSYEGIFFINENTGWICGSGQLIFKTTNGGVSFDSVSIYVGYNFDIYFRNANEGLVCGEAASMFKTSNGGQNWTEIIVPVGIEGADFFRLSPVNNDIIYTQGVQNNKVYKSTNFGNNWDSIARVQGADDSYAVFFPNENTGWSAGSVGLMFKTTNGGYNWQPEVLPPIPTSGYRGLWFYNDSIGWAIGGNTKIVYTSNGGTPSFIVNSSQIVKDFIIYQNYPNPFNSSTLIEFYINKTDNYNIEIFNLLGQRIQIFSYNKLSPGKYKINFKAENLSSSIYFYKISNFKNSITKSMMLIK